MTRLPQLEWLTARSTRRVIDALEAERPGSARFVGGCVRNALLNEPVGDIDIATQLTPDIVTRVLKAADCAVHPTGIDHGTVTAVSHNRPFEITTLRRDVATDGRHATIAFTEDWSEDAQRRDFTINALYADPQGEVFDPTGQGLGDISVRNIVFVGDPETRLREDYLRILRFFRFLAWYGREEPDPAGLAACARHVDGLEQISAERIWAELKKLLSAPDPMAAIEAMEASGVFQKIVPKRSPLGRLAFLVDIERRDGRAPDPLLRVLALCEDSPSAPVLLARRMKASNDESDRLRAAFRIKGSPESGMSDSTRDQLAYRNGEAALSDVMMLLRAAQSDRDAEWKVQLDRLATWRRPHFPVGGADVIAAGVPEGPKIGPLLRALESEWIESDFALSREALLARIRELAAG